jgi:sugar lactone lactonase YvrE
VTITALLPVLPSPTSGPTPDRRPGRRWRRIVAGLVGGLVLAVLAFLALPSPIDPLAWTPPPAPPLVGVLAPNQALAGARLVTATPDGPEDITFDAEGRLYTGDESGTIYRLDPDDAGRVERFANTGGRPNGLRFASDGRLLVADTRRGLLSVDPDGTVTVLTDRAGGIPLALTNELAVAHDGTVYASDSTRTRYDDIDLIHELLEQRPSGRLVRYDPRTRRTDVLLTGLSLANGVALAPDDSFVLVAESFRYQITRYWLSGPRAGTSDVFAGNLPGFPDNITATGDGTFWVALYQPRNATLDGLQSHPFVKAQLAKLPDSVLAGSTVHASTALRLDVNGHPIQALSDSTGHLYGLTTVVPHDGYLYLGTDHAGSNDVLRYRSPSED